MSDGYSDEEFTGHVATPNLPDSDTIRAVAQDLEWAADAIGALHIDDVGPDHASELRELQRDLRAHADELHYDADEAEGDVDA